MHPAAIIASIASALLLIPLLLGACAQEPAPEASPAQEPPAAQVPPAALTNAAPALVESAAIDAIFSDIGATEPGAAVLVMQGDEIVYEQGYGLTELETGSPITPDTIFQIASAGKQFTGLAVMLLHEDGLLTYDDPITTHLPELAALGEPVTIRQLLHHTAGMPDYHDDLEEEYGTPTNADALAWLARAGRLQFAPGSAFAYSNAGYEVLGSLVERVSGQRFADFLQARIFGPLALQQSFSLPNPQRKNDPLRARGYEVGESGAFTLYDDDPLDNLVGSGSVYSSARDMGRYITALLQGDLVGLETLEVGLTPATLTDGTESPYGFGWDIVTTAGAGYIGHSGSWQGFVSHIAHFADGDLTVIVLANRTDRDPQADALTIAEMYGAPGAQVWDQIGE